MARGTAAVNQDKCDGCEECVLSCPAEVLEIIDGRIVAARVEDCTACKTCEQVCPKEAIKISET